MAGVYQIIWGIINSMTGLIINDVFSVEFEAGGVWSSPFWDTPLSGIVAIQAKSLYSNRR